MAEPTTIARPYAEAAFEIARADNALPAWSSMLRYASAVVAGLLNLVAPQHVAGGGQQRGHGD